MSASENVAIVKQLYQAIEQSDRTLISPFLTEDIQWYGLTLNQGVEAKRLQGVQEIIDFFDVADRVLQRNWFPETLLPQGEHQVVVLGKGEYTSKLTDYRFEDDWIHLFTLKNGQISEFRAYLNAVTLLAISS
ncbi:MAG: hypothetical protein AAGF26_02730 [Cyanobacteria bacterium P01_G01_bin.49]